MVSLQTINYLSWAWIAIAVATFILLLFITAPYGRHTRKGWGAMVDNRWAWFWMEMPSFAILLMGMWMGTPSGYAMVLGLLWLAHYFHRSFIFPLRIRTKGKKMPVSVIAMAVFFNGVNAGLNGYYLGFLENYADEAFLSWHFCLGLALFIGGAWINQHSDLLLINLRKPGETGYKIPGGGFFRWVSCPNFFGEIVEWGGFALMAWNWPAVSFFIWTAANVIPRALRHHQWYQEQFPDYPGERKAVIPYLL
jgi:3-oxo-5-alpha-steroid 4-dehydrogenase 1